MNRNVRVKIIGNQISKPDVFITPYSIKVYKKHFYVIDRLSHRLFKYTLGGVGGAINSTVGSGDGQLYFPYDILLVNDKIYVADGGNYRIQVFGLDGEYLFQFGGFGCKDNQFTNGGIFNGDGRSSNPQNLFLDQNNNISAVDVMNKKIKVFDQQGEFIYQYTLPGMQALGCCVEDEYGNKFVADTKRNLIAKYNSSLKLEWECGCFGRENGEFQIPWRIRLYNNLIWVSDLYNHRIQVFTLTGDYIGQIGDYGSGFHKVNYIFGFDFDDSGRMYLTDTWNHRIKICDENYICKKIIGGTQEDLVLRPSGIKLSVTKKSFFVTDYLNHSIAEFSITGKFLRRFGNLGNQNGNFCYPNDIFIDSDETMYISDSKNKRIYIANQNTGYEKVINSTESIDFFPSSVVCSVDRIYVADILNSRILEFDKVSLEYRHTIIEKGNDVGQILSKYKTHFIRLDIWNSYLIIADASNNRIQVFDLKQNCICAYYDIKGQIPTRARVISDDKMLVVCRGSNSVYVLDRKGCEKKVFGTGKIGNDDDDLIAPWDADYDSNRNVLIVLDSLSNRIKLINDVVL